MTSLRLTSCGNKMKEIGLFALALFAGTLGYGMVWYSMIWYVRTKGYINGKRVPNFSVRHFLDGLHKVLAYNIKVCTDTACNPNLEPLKSTTTINVYFWLRSIPVLRIELRLSLYLHLRVVDRLLSA